MNEGYEAYKKYLSIKLHFTKDEYDFFKYNGEINAKYETFIQRNDRYFLLRLQENTAIILLIILLAISYLINHLTLRI